jgi:hypothetical protein
VISLLEFIEENDEGPVLFLLNLDLLF